MLSGIQYQTVTLPPTTQKIVFVSDTHTTSRSPDLHPSLIPAIHKIQPDVIFHAGDICLPNTIHTLEDIAPVIAVRGNRDITQFSHLPEACVIHLHSLKLLLTHGHAPFKHYILDKFHYLYQGFRFARYYDYLNSFCADAQYYLFGHTHVAFQHQVGTKHYINPGAACFPSLHDPYPSFVSLTVSESGLASTLMYLG